MPKWLGQKVKSTFVGVDLLVLDLDDDVRELGFVENLALEVLEVAL